MSERSRQPSSVTLSAQSLAFSPQQGFAVVAPGTSSSSSASSNVVGQFPSPMMFGQQNQGHPNPTDVARQAQKVREYEQQRSKLQQLNAKGHSTASPDAMIAQMMGKPLASMNQTPTSVTTANRRLPAPSNAASPYMYMNHHGNYPASAPPFMAQMAPGMVPSMAPPGMELRHPSPQTPAVGNRPHVPASMAHQFVMPESGSALQLTPKDLEKMMNQFAAGLNGKYPPTPNSMGEMGPPGFKASPTPMDGVFVIPAISPMVTPDGAHHQHHHLGGPVGAQMTSPMFFMPPWTRDPSKIPDEYAKFLNVCSAPNRSAYGMDLPDTGSVYVLLRTSGLSNEILGTIWALTNRSQPGQLVKEEFFAALALVAIAQETGAVASFESLSNLSRPPIPRLSTSGLSSIPPTATGPTATAQQHQSGHASTIPTIPSPLTNSATPIDRRPSTGTSKQQSTTVVTQPPSNSGSLSSSSRISADDFGEFTDFQAATTTPIAQPIDHAPVSQSMTAVTEPNPIIPFSSAIMVPQPMTPINASTYIDSKSTSTPIEQPNDQDPYAALRSLEEKSGVPPLPVDSSVDGGNRRSSTSIIDQHPISASNYVSGRGQSPIIGFPTSESVNQTKFSGPPKIIAAGSSASKSQDDAFGDFTAATTTTMTSTFSADQIQSSNIPSTHHHDNLISNFPPANFSMSKSRTDPRLAPPSANNMGGGGFNLETVSGQKKDINELLRQNFESFGFGQHHGGSGGLGAKSDEDNVSIKSGSKEPSIHSLDLQSLKQFDMDQQETAGDIDQFSQSINPTMRSPAGSISLVDRYAAFRENGEKNGESDNVEKHVDVWTKCLESCLQLLKRAENIFVKASDESTRKEILSTERGSKYLCGNVQIYRVSKRIRLSLQTMAFQTDKLIDIITDIDSTWSNLTSLLAFSGLLPTPENLDFRNALISSSSSSNSGPVADGKRKHVSCGICLLNVDVTCKTDQGTNFDYKLSYGGRQYHAQCANLWINCIDSVLPSLDVPCLL